MAQCRYKITDAFDGRILVAPHDIYRLSRPAIYKRAQQEADELGDEVFLINLTHNTVAGLYKPKS